MSGEIRFYAARQPDPRPRTTLHRRGQAGSRAGDGPSRRGVTTPASRRWVDGSPTYVDLSVWGDQAEHVADSLRKGDRIVVLGRWTTPQLHRGRRGAPQARGHGRRDRPVAALGDRPADEDDRQAEPAGVPSSDEPLL